MSKLFAHLFLSLLISLGLIAGIPNVRKEVTHVFNDIKATAQQTVDTTVNAASDLTSQVNSKLKVDASSNTPVKVDSKTKADAETKVDSSAKLSLGDSSVKLTGNTQTTLNLGLNSGK